MPSERLTSNRAVRMLDAAVKGKYGVLGVVSYNMETIIASIQAAEAQNAPIQILLFPWALKYSPLLVDFAALAARKSRVPVTVHMDHAQDPDIIRQACEIRATDGTPAFDSIMVDMSHYEKAENLAKTKELVALCRSHGIATEAEPGRIEGGEDGVKDTAELEGMMTTPEEVAEFVATGIDFLAPAIGNMHGDYHGVQNIHLDYDRLEAINAATAALNTCIVLHGTNEFPPDTMAACISRGITRVNVNKLVLSDYNDYVAANTGKVPLTELLEVGTGFIRKSCEEWMLHLGCVGKAFEGFEDVKSAA